MKILVNGIGNIGTTLLLVLAKNKNLLGLSEIYGLKNTAQPWQKADLSLLEKKGVKICTYKEDGYLDAQEVLARVDYIFDATANGFGMKNKAAIYDKLKNLKGACAQGSEKEFGISFKSGINEDIVKGEKFVHVVSCNTHSLATILTTFCGDGLENLDKADFVIVRRSEDIGNHERLVSGNVVARHLNPDIGTHHSIDVIDMFAEQKIVPNITSSDITTPSQVMHSVRFNIDLKKPLAETPLSLIEKNKLVSTTTKFDSNVIFELGRRYSPYGRIYSQAIFVANNMIVKENNIKGWAFIPQEGNTILSSIHAFLLQTDNKNTAKIMIDLQLEMIVREW